MNYSNDLDTVINSALDELIDEYKSGAIEFNEKKNREYLNLYLNLKKESENSNFNQIIEYNILDKKRISNIKKVLTFFFLSGILALVCDKM